MKPRKYTLPRHTILAKNSTRTGAFIVDLAIFLGLTLALTYGVFINIFKGITTPLYNELTSAQVESHLFFEEDGAIIYPTKDTPNDEFIDRLSYFYTSYLKDLNVEIKNADGLTVEYTVEWFNKNILGIKGENPDAETDTGLFTYKVIDETYDTSVVGVPKAGVADSSINEYLQKQLEPAINGIFFNIPHMYEIVSKYNFYYSLSFVLSGIISSIITYVIFPLIFKNGVTIGKKLFNLCLASSQGYAINNWQLGMRLMPSLVLLLSFLLPIYTDLFYLMLAAMVIFLVSFTLSMASPKRAALHDFCARTIVIDSKASILFKNEVEEEAYLLKEDYQETQVKNENGEEPELKYEK